MKSWQQILLSALLILLVFMVFLWRLDGTKLWRDEATTACWAREVIQSENHLPNAWNGRVLVAQAADGHDFNEQYLPAMQGWLQFYVSALFFKLFGISTFSARLPFALLGILGLWGFFRIGKTLFQDSRYGYLAILIASLTFTYIFYVRQCRYYALALFFIIMMLQEIIYYLHHREYGQNWLFYLKMGVLGIFLYFSNYLTFATFWGALGIGLLLTAEKKVIWRFLLLSVILGLILSLEFYLMHWDFVTTTMEKHALQLPDYLKLFRKNLRRLNRIIPFYVMIPLGIVIYFKDFRKNPALRHTLIMLLSVIFISFVLTGILAKKHMFVRYYIQVIPATIILFLIFFQQIQTRWHLAAAIPLLIAGLTWHNLAIFTKLNESVVQRQFLKQDHENGPIVDFIQKNIKPGETVAVYRNVKGMAIYFYCPDLFWVGQLDSQNPLNHKYRGKLPDYVFDDFTDIDWYILWNKREFNMEKVSDYELRWKHQYFRRRNWWKKRKKRGKKLTYEVFKKIPEPVNEP